jgi:hypothetical protein
MGDGERERVRRVFSYLIIIIIIINYIYNYINTILFYL